MREGNAIRSNGFTIRTLKTLNIWLGKILFTFPGKRGSLLLSDTSTLGLVEDKRRRAVIWMREAVDTVIVLVANKRIFVIEKSISTITALV